MNAALHRVLTPALGLVLAGALAAGCGESVAAGPKSASEILVVTPDGHDSAPCTATEPCQTFERAYKMALPGQVVELAGGSFPKQEVGGDEKAGTKRVVFRRQAGADVRVEELNIDATHLEFRGFTAGEVKTLAGAKDVILRDLTIRGGLFVLSSQRVSMIGGSVGPGVDFHPIIGAATATPPRQIVIDGVLFHDWTRTGPEVHTECLQIGAGDGITIRNSRFRNCDVMDMHVSWYGDAPMTKNVTLENNFFAAATDGGFYAVEAKAFTNLLLRNNSFGQAFKIFTDEGPNKNVRVIGNVGPYQPWACEKGVSYRYNVWTRVRCGKTDRKAPSGFVNAAAGNFHLKAGAAAVNRGDPKSYPTKDIDGQKRPKGRAPDAGADERP